METVSKESRDGICHGQVNHGDCLAGLRAMPEKSVQLVFADPPFNIGYEYDQYDDRLESQQYLDWSGQWMTEVHRVLDETGAFWLAIGDEYAAELKVQAQQIGFHTRSWVIWYYTFGVHCRYKFTRSHAHLFHFVKDPKQFTFNASEVSVPSARQLVYGDRRANPAGRMPDDTWILRPQDCVDGFTPDEDTWYFPRVAGTFKERAGYHGCQMPEQLLGRVIRSCSDPGDVVLDPFAGSCTTLIVAKKLGRKFLGFEMSDDYARMGQTRIESIAEGDPLEGSPEPKASVPSTFSPKARRLGQGLPERRGFDDSQLELFATELAPERLIEVFKESSRGFSVDRVIADPVLNEDFQKLCDREGIDGSAGERNRALFDLRKSGQLKQAGVEALNRTSFDWMQLDPHLHAGEIAWASVNQRYGNATLDEILCDPRLAIQYDEIAAGWAPGFTALEYRWGALKLRRSVAAARQRLETWTPEQLGLHKFEPAETRLLSDLVVDNLPHSAGVYRIGAVEGASLYVGETANLRARLSVQLSESARERWPVDCQNPEQIQLAFYPLQALGDVRLSRQLQLQIWYQPDWNFNRLLAVE